MAHSEWCGKCACGDCEIAMRNECALDQSMPCSPSCKNLGGDGSPIDLIVCIEDGCDAYSDSEKAEYIIERIKTEVSDSDMAQDKKGDVLHLLNMLPDLLWLDAD